jgi:hypothetical protein
MRDDCLRKAVKPNLKKGDAVSNGRFGWCLEKGDVRRQFQEDGKDAEEPIFGWVIKEKVLVWDEERPLYADGVSMNCLTCSRSEVCAVAFHPKPDKFKHLAVFDLEQLNLALGEKMPVRALYDPDPPDVPPNPCHFVVRPEGRPLSDLAVAIQMWSSDLRHHKGQNNKPFNPPKTPPKPESAEAARELSEKTEYEKVLLIAVNVWPPPAEPAPQP